MNWRNVWKRQWINNEMNNETKKAACGNKDTKLPFGSKKRRNEGGGWLCIYIYSYFDVILWVWHLWWFLFPICFAACFWKSSERKRISKNAWFQRLYRLACVGLWDGFFCHFSRCQDCHFLRSPVVLWKKSRLWRFIKKIISLRMFLQKGMESDFDPWACSRVQDLWVGFFIYVPFKYFFWRDDRMTLAEGLVDDFSILVFFFEIYSRGCHGRLTMLCRGDRCRRVSSTRPRCPFWWVHVGTPRLSFQSCCRRTLEQRTWKETFLWGRVPCCGSFPRLSRWFVIICHCFDRCFRKRCL